MWKWCQYCHWCWQKHLLLPLSLMWLLSHVKIQVLRLAKWLCTYVTMTKGDSLMSVSQMTLPVYQYVFLLIFEHFLKIDCQMKWKSRRTVTWLVFSAERKSSSSFVLEECVTSNTAFAKQLFVCSVFAEDIEQNYQFSFCFHFLLDIFYMITFLVNTTFCHCLVFRILSLKKPSKLKKPV